MRTYYTSASTLKILHGLAKLRIEITTTPEGRRLGSLPLPGWNGRAYIVIDLTVLVWRPIYGHIELT